LTDVSALLVAECQTLVRYLCGQAADPEVVRAYAAAHEARRTLHPASAAEQALLRLAVRAPVLLRSADAYARHWQPRGALRKKLVLVLAILESSRRFHRTIEIPPSSSWIGAVASLAASAAAGAVAVACAVVVVAPALRLMTLRGRP